MRKKRITNKSLKTLKEYFEPKKSLMCAIRGCNGIAGEFQHYCLEHRRELRIDDAEVFNLRYVYFVMAIGTEKIKIGVTVDLDRRIYSLQTGSPCKLLLLVAFPGDESLEHTLHVLLDEYRSNGEWFIMSDELMDVVEIALNEGERA